MQSVPISKFIPWPARRLLAALCLAAACLTLTPDVSANAVRFTVKRASNRGGIDFPFGVPPSPNQQQSVEEGNTTITFRIYLDVAPANGSASVQWSTIDLPSDPAFSFLQRGSDYAVKDVDYIPASGTVTINQNDTTLFRDITVTLLADPNASSPSPEFNKDIFVRLLNNGGSPTTSSTSDSASLSSDVLSVSGPFVTALQRVEGRVASVTILDTDQPGGALDRDWNYDNNFFTVPPYNPLPGANDTVNAVAVDPTESSVRPRTIIGGDFTSFNTQPINRIARINFDGSIDNNFNPGQGADNFVSSIAVNTNSSSVNRGMIIVGGGFSAIDGTSRKGIARLTSTGALDSGFDPGAGFNGPVRSVVIQPDDKIVVGGQFTLFNGVSRTNVARLNADGTLDASFNPGSGLGTDGTVYSVSLQSNPPPIPIPTVSSGTQPNTNVISVGANAGTLILTANMYPVANALRIYYGDRLKDPANAVLMTNVSFSFVRSFNIPFGPTVPGVGGVTGGPFNTITVTIDEGQNNSTKWDYSGSISTVTAGPEIVIGGDFTMVGGVARSRIALLRQDGTLDTGFDPGTGADATVFATAVEPSGAVLLGGSFSSVNVSSRNGIARLKTDGSLDTTFNPGTGANGRVSGIVLDANSQPVIVGAFTKFNGTARTNVARLLTTGVLDTGFMDVAYNQYAGPFNSSLGSGFQPFFGVPRSTPWTLAPVGPATFLNAVAIQSDGNILVGGNFTDFGAAASLTFSSEPHDAGKDPFNFLPGGQSTIFNNHIPLNLTTAELRILRMNQTKPRQNVARLIGRSTAGSGNLDFISATYSVTEGPNTTAFLKLQRSNGHLGPVNVTFATRDGTATTNAPNPDYTQNAGTVKWNSLWSGSAGSGLRQLWDSQTGVISLLNNSIISIGVINDNISEPDETVHIDLSTVAGNTFLGDGGNGGNGRVSGLNVPLSPALGFQNSAILTIVDDDFNAGTFNFSSANYSVLENAGTATITVTRTGGSAGLVTVQYDSSVPVANAATPGSDYTAVSGTLTFLTGETNKTFTVPILNDATVEQDELVTLILSNPSGGAKVLGSPNDRATLTIIDNDFAPGRLSLSSAPYTVAENAGYLDLTVTRTGGSVGASAVVFKTSDNTAVTGVDYWGTTNLLTWGNGDATPRTIRIPIINNQMVDGNRVFNVDLDLATFTNSAAGLTISSTVTITDDDVFGSVQFISQAFSVTENGGVATITVVRTGSGGTVTVNFNTSDLSPAPGAATAGVDYNAVGVPAPVTLSMGPGVTSATIDIPIINDSLDTTAIRSLFLNLAVATGTPGNVSLSIIGSPARLDIYDDESFNITAGSLDSLFTPGSGPNGVVQTVARQPDGKLLIGGEFTEFNNVARNRIARLNANGTLDVTFLSTQSGANNTVRKILMQPNGQILVAGEFVSTFSVKAINNTNLQYLARLNIDGSIDSAFNPGTGPDNLVSGLALQSDGKIIVVGDFATFNGVQANFIVRLDTNGVVDATFSTGTGADGSIQAVAVQPDGKILVGGEFTTINGATNAHRIARLNTDGSVDPTFFLGVANNANGVNGDNDIVRAIALQSDGKIVIGGIFSQVNGTNNLNYARLLNDGMQDGQLDVNQPSGNFSPGDANDVVNAIAIQPDGKIVLVGDFTTCNGVTRNRITRLQADGTVDPTINFGSGANGVVNAALIQPTDGMIVIGGGFNAYDGVPINYLARLNGGSLGGQGRLEFSSANFAADEKGGSAVITVRRTGGTAGTVTANYQTSDITATNGVHYTGFTNVTHFLSFPNGETLKTFTITTTNDNIVNMDRQVNLALFNFTNSLPALDPTLAGNQTNAVLTIVNDDFTLGFVANTFTVSENVVGGFATITVQRSGGVTRPASVLYATSDGTASSSGANPKYVATSGLLNFAAGQSVATFNIPILNETAVEGDSTVKLSLSGATGDVVAGGIVNATLNIIDDDTAPGDLQFSSATYGVDEAAGSVVITITRTNGSLGRVAVNYTTSNGTGIAGTDYTTTAGNISFANGQTSRTFTVPILVNSSSTNNTTVNLSLNTPTPAGQANLGSQSTAVLTITNNDLVHGNFVFKLANYTTPEGPAPGIITKQILVSRIGGPGIPGTNGTVTVAYTITNGTAIAGRDYTNSATPLHDYTGTITWADGVGGDQFFFVDLVDNGLVDGDRTVNLRLSLVPASNGASLGATNTAVLTILDDETAGGEFNFAQAGFSGLKNGGAVPITITRTKGKTGAVDLHFFTTDGTAVNFPLVSPGDYNQTDLTVSFTNNQTSAVVMVPIVPNSISTGNKVLSLTLNNLVSGVGVPGLPALPPAIGSQNIASLTIVDDVPPAGSGDSGFTPGTGANAPVHALALRTDGQLVIGGEFTAYNGINRTNVALLQATGMLDQNFDVGTVKFGAVAGSVRTLGVQADNKVVIGGLFDTINGTAHGYLARFNTNGTLDASFVATGANSQVNALVVQNNGRIVVGGTFTAVNGAVRNFIARLSADGNVDGGFLQPSGGPDNFVWAVAVDTIGRVLIGGDFLSVDGMVRGHIARLKSDGTLDPTFDPGANVDGSVRSIAIDTDGTIIIGGLFNNYGATPRNYVARLTSTGALDPSFSPVTGANDYVNSVALQSDGKIVVGGGFSLFNGLNRNGIARLMASGAVDPSINFGSGANDDVDALLVQPNGGIVLGGWFTLFNGVTNNYVARVNGGTNFGAGVFGFSAATYSVNENGGSITINVTRVGGSSNSVVLNYSTTNLTALAGTHYVTNNGSLTFLEGETIKSFVVQIRDDFFTPATNVNRTFELGLSANFTGIPGNPSLGQSTAVVTIIDNESVIGFSAATYNAIENGGPAPITITRAGGTNDAVSVRFFTTDGTAVSPGRYTGVTNTVNFAPGQTVQTVNITIPDNLVVNGDETVNLWLDTYLDSTTPGSALRGLTNATLKIIDNEVGPGAFAFSAGAYSVNENTGGTNVTITVRRTSGQQGPVSVNYATSNGTGVSGVHYTATVGTLSWNNGDNLPKTFTVPILNNFTVSGTRTVNLTLSNPSAPATLGSPSTAVLTIFDNDTGLQFSQSAYTVMENGTNAVITVYRPDALAGTVTVNFAATAGSATAGADFALTNGTLSFGPGVTNLSFAVRILDNPVGYTNTTVNLALSGATGGGTVSATKGAAILTIIDVAAGAVDLSFGSTLGANGAVYSLAFMTNGQVVLGGDFTAVNSVPVNRVARLNSNGTTDLGFNPGAGANNTVYAVAVQTNNNAVIIGGAFTTVGAFNQGRIARLTSTGATDFSFNFGGAGADNTVYALGVDTNGFILAGGAFTNINGTARGGIARLTTFGAVDATFNPSTGANGAVRALDIDGFNRTVIGGDFTLVNNTVRTRIARLTSDGGLDGSFNPGLGADATVYSIKVTPSGKILVAGAFTNFNGLTKYGITQLNSDGSIDPGFNAGIGANGVVTALEIDTNGRILVMGDFTTFNGTSRVRFARLNSNGSLDGNFDPGSGANGIVNAVTVLKQPVPPVINSSVNGNGFGSHTNIIDTGSTAGTIVINFDMFGLPDDMRVYYGDRVNDLPNAVLIYQTNTVNQGNFTVTYGPGSTTIITIIMDEGSLNGTFWDYTVSIIPDATPGLVPDRIVIGGDFTSVDGTPRDRFAEINNDGSLNKSYGMGVSLPVVLALGINNNLALPTLFGKTVAGGNFSVINGVNANNIVRLNLDGSVDLNFNPGTGANGQVNTLAVQTDGKVIIGGAFTSVNGTARKNIARLNSNGSLDATFDPGIGANNPIFSIALQPNSKILVGGLFTSYNTTTRNYLTRLNANGAVDNTFSPVQGPNDVVRAIAVQSDGNIVIGGDFSSYDGQSRSRLARLTSTGALDPSFDAGAGVDNIVSAITIDASGSIVVGGSFTAAFDSNPFDTVDWSGIARFDSAGTVDLGLFNPGVGFNDYVTSIALEPGLGGKLVVAGAFTSFNGVTENRIVRLNNDGSLDTTINFGSGANNYIAAAQLQNDGKIVIGGAFTSVDGVPRAAVARLNGGANDDSTSAGVFEFSAANFTVNENGQAATITVIRRGVLTGTASVDFSTGNGTAIFYPGAGPTTGFNYTNTSLALLFVSGQSSTNFTIGIIDDGATNADRTVGLTLSSPVSISNPTAVAGLGNISTSTLTIVDDDSVLNFSTPSYSVTEDGIEKVITVNRLGGLANAVSVQFTTSDGTALAYPGVGAVAGFDYTNSFGTLTWPVGDSSPKTFKVGIIDNLTTNGNRALNLTLFNAVNLTMNLPLTLNGTTNATLTINDNEFGPGVFGFATNAFYVAEGNNPATNTYNFLVVRKNGSTGPIKINYTTVNGTAVAGLDYVATSGQLSFANLQVTNSIAVKVIGDSIVEGDETFGINLSIASGTATLGQGRATVHIVDDDGVIQFSSAKYTNSEAEAVAIITVTKTPVTSGTIRVDYATSNGTATSGLDYTGVTNTLIFLQSETTKTFTVPLLEDLLPEGDETVNLRLFNLVGLGYLGSLTNAVLIITDNDTGLKFSAATYSVPESVGNATITVLRTGNTNSDVSVTYSTSNGSATSGSDYTAQFGTLRFAPGVISQTFSIPIVDDPVVEGNETVNLKLTLANGAILSTPNTAVLTIVDNDMSFDFIADKFNIPENGGNASIVVRRNGLTTTAESVTVSTSDGTATAGADYTARVGVVLNFGVGITSQTLTIPITNDALPEGDETVNLTLSNPSGIAILGATNTAVLTIQDDDIVVQFTAPVFSFSEGSSNALIVVQRQGSTNNPSTLTMTTAAGTATAGVDYFNVTTNLTFAPGVTNLTVAIPLVEDLLLEVAETVTLTLSNPSAGVTLGAQRTSLLRIVDNDRIGSLDSAFDPGFGTDGIVNAVSLQSDGKVLIGGDFTKVNGTNRFGIARLNADGTLDLSFDPLQGVNGPVYAVAVDSQNRVLIGGLFTTVGGQFYANICRLSSAGSVDFAFADPGINANGAVTAIAVVNNGFDDILVAGDFTIVGPQPRNRIARILSNGSVDVSFNPGDGANAMVNALAIDRNGNVLVGGFFSTFFDGSSRGGVARLSPNGTLDPNFDPAMNIGSVIYSLGVQTNGFVVLGGDFNTVNGFGRTNVARLDNDGLIDLPFDPGAGVNSIVRSLAIDLNGHVLIGGDFTMVNNTNRNGIARLGADGSLDPDLAISTSGSFDPGIGASGTVNAVVAQPDGKALVGGDFVTMDGVNRRGIARLNGDQGRLQFSSPTYSFAKHSPLGAVFVTVNRVGGSSGTISFDYLTTEGTATTNSPDADYIRAAATVTIPPGVTSTNIPLSFVVDSVVQTNESFNISVSNPTGASTLGTPTNAIVTIVNDNVSFSFSSATYTVLESGVFVPVTITRQGDLTAAVSVNLTTGGGTATSTPGPNQDYTDASQPVDFAPTETNRTVFILINQDTFAEGDETVNLTLSGAVNVTGGASLVAPSTSTLTIVDDDVEFNFSLAAYRVNEVGTNAVITVTRRGDTNSVASVVFTTSDLTPAPGAATAGVDYTAVFTNLVFAAGQVSTNVLVPIMNDTIPEGDEVINLALSGESITSNASGFASVGLRESKVTILDDDVGFSFSSSTFTVNEANSPAVITIVRTGDTNQAASVNFSTTTGLATAGLDYLARLNVRVDFAPGVTTRTNNIIIINDSLAEGDETVNLTLSNPSSSTGNASLVTPSLATLTIVDNDVGFGFAAPNFQVNEGDGNATITVTRFGDINAPASVNFTTSDGTATTGADYTAVTRTLRFASGQVSTNVLIPIINDSLVEGDEFLNLTLASATNLTGSVTFAQKTATLTIVDNDVSFSFSSATFSVLENQPTATITVTRTGDTNRTATVEFATTNGTATAGLDYVGQTNVLTFLPTQVSTNISIPILSDLFAEGNETVFLSLANPATSDVNGTAFLGAIPAATLTILDDDFVTIVADSFVLTAESFAPANNGIDQNELVTVAFALRNDGNVPTENLTAKLRSTGGVTSPIPSGTTNYGALLPSGGSTNTNSFTFTASAAQLVNATFDLADGTTNLGTVTFSIQMGSQSTWTNRSRLNVPGSLTVPSSGPASLYPSPIVVSNLNGVVNKVVVTLNQITHTFPDDINMLLVSPTGEKVLLMANAGGGFALANVTLTLDDAADLPLPDASQIFTRGYKPANYLPTVNAFPAPAPAGPYAATLSAFNGIKPNGTWSLYVFDDTAGDNGLIQSGWTLTLYTVNPTVDLAVSLVGPTDLVLGGRIIYTTTITNKGPFTATGVTLTNTLPVGATFIPASSSPGSYTNAGGQVVYNVGSLTNGASVTVTIVVTPTVPGVNSSTATVVANQIELNSADNTVGTTTQVNGAALSSAASKGLFSLTLLGQTSRVYVIEASSDLTVWIPVSTNSVTDGTLIFTDKDAATYPRRFYRAIER